MRSLHRDMVLPVTPSSRKRRFVRINRRRTTYLLLQIVVGLLAAFRYSAGHMRYLAN